VHRREKLLAGLDLARQKGIEIGPLDHPLVLKAQGDVRYVDYADAAFLRHKYRDDPNVDTAAIPEIDAVWGDSTVAEALGAAHAFDYALASHVVEHVPDLITWLDELHAVLKPGATLRLAVPDRRYTFDFMRHDSAVSEAVTAHVLRLRAPTPGQLIDSALNHHIVDRRELWAGAAARQPRYSRVERLPHAVGCARQIIEQGVYIDVHCWVFTPASFCELMEQLVALGYLRFACERLFDTERDEDEFIVILRANDDQAACLESWRTEGEALRAGERERDLAAATQAALQAAAAAQEAARAQAEATARLEQRFAALERRTAPLAWLARRALARVRG
jgi:SAM-dependent methyltransferase